MSKFVPTVVFDFDGVIHSYSSGWQGAAIIPDPPVPGIREAIAEIRAAGYRVVVVSTRCSEAEGKVAVYKYLDEHSIMVDGVYSHKPPALVYIDDRALCFDGNAAGLLAQIKKFKPWYQKPYLTPCAEVSCLHNAECCCTVPRYLGPTMEGCCAHYEKD